MKYFVRHFFTGLMVLALTSAVAFAKVKRESIELQNDTMVAGTLVKAGTYDVKFDSKTGELTLLKPDSSKVIVKTTGHLKDRATKSHGTQYDLDGNTLVSIAFDGQMQDVVIAPSGTPAEQ